MNSKLNDFDIKEIQQQAREKLGLCGKTNDIIGTQIFSIISLYARVIYYPLGEKAPWGFTRISGSQNDSNLDKPFVAINSSIPMDCQVFAAAHELYHIWFEHNPDVIPADLLSEDDKVINEKKANRFAAEFLIDEHLLMQEISLYGISEYNIKSVLQLAAIFNVPYRTMVKRLGEINLVNDNVLKNLLEESEETVEKYKIRYSIPVQKADERVAMDNLVELSINAYEKGYITFEKLEYLLGMSNLKPMDLGIDNKTTFVFPSDEELDSIMEE